MPRIKVCQVLNAFRVGGAETVALDLARGLDPRRFETLAVALIAPRATGEPAMGRRFREAGVPTHALHHRSFRDPRTLLDILRFLRRHRPDVVHAHNRFADYWSLRCAGWARVGHGVYTRHSAYRDLDGRQRRRYQALAHRLPVVIAVSEEVRRNCIETEGLPADKVCTVVNGIDLERVRPLAPAERRAARAELGVADHEAARLFVGRLIPAKAPEAFVALVHVLRRRGLAVRGFLCGYGELESAVQRACQDGDGVRWLGLRRDVPRLLGACDLVVSTSRVEGLPLNVMEAMAAGAAFVGPDLPQIAQLTATAPLLRAGLFPRPPQEGAVPADLIDRWADLAAARLAAPDLRAQCGEIGRRIIAAEFSLERMVRAHEQIYRGLVAADRSPR